MCKDDGMDTTQKRAMRYLVAVIALVLLLWLGQLAATTADAFTQAGGVLG